MHPETVIRSFDMRISRSAALLPDGTRASVVNLR